MVADPAIRADWWVQPGRQLPPRPAAAPALPGGCMPAWWAGGSAVVGWWQRRARPSARQAAPGDALTPVTRWRDCPPAAGASEVFAMIGSLEMFYSQAPDAMRSTCAALQLVATALGARAALPVPPGRAWAAGWMHPAACAGVAAWGRSHARINEPRRLPCPARLPQAATWRRRWWPSCRPSPTAPGWPTT